MEQLFERDDLWNNFGKVYISNMLILYSGSHEQSIDAIPRMIDLNMLRNEMDIPRKISDAIIVSERVYRECYDEFRKLMPRAAFMMWCQSARLFFNSYNIDQPLYKKAHDEKSYINPADIQFTRVHSVNILPIFASFSCPTNYVFDVNDSVAQMSSWRCAMENDLVGTPKDSIGYDFCPVSMVNYRMRKDNCEMLPAMKSVANELNSLRRSLELIISNMDHQRRPVFELKELFSHLTTDFHFNLGINEPQSRYGWLPVVDK